MAAAPAPEMRYLRRAAAANPLPAWMVGRRRRRVVPAGVLQQQQQQLLDVGRALMLLGVLVLTWQLQGITCCVAEHVMVAFLLWLLGAAVTMLSLVAPRFPRLAAGAAALSRALRAYLLGGI
ncbi:hypothetical protein ACP4OV_022202 [Aristida adscensionis]